MNRYDVLMKLAEQLYGHRKLGEILVAHHRLAAEDLEAALAVQREDRHLRRLGSILVERGLTSVSDFMFALSKQLPVCVRSLRKP